MKLTAKQESFCQSIAYKEFDHIWEAYQANYNTKKMGINTIYAESCKLRANHKITIRIKEIESEIVTKSQSTLDEILSAMSIRVRLDMRAYFDNEGKFKEVNELTLEQAMCIQDFQVEEIWGRVGKDKMQIGELKKVKLIDLKGLWDMFLKKYGAYITNINVKTDNLEHLTDLLKEIEE